jgi:hypothetical protein
MNARKRALLDQVESDLADIEVMAEELARRASSQPPTPPPSAPDAEDDDIGMPLVFITST